MSRGVGLRGVGGGLLGGCLVLLFLLFGNQQPWQEIQVENSRRQAEVLRQRLQSEDARLAETLVAQRHEVETRRRVWESHRDEVNELDQQRQVFAHKRTLAERRVIDSRRSYDLAMKSSEASDVDLDELRQAMHFDRREVEEMGILVADRQAKLDALRADLTMAEEALEVQQQPLQVLRQQLDEVTLAAPLQWNFLAPLASSIAIREVHPEVLQTTQPPAVERCTTCHLGVLESDRGESWPPVLRTHPQPELYLGSTSPHPVESFGCTVCHGGDGRATDVRRADHDGNGDDPALTMLPKGLVESSCRQCHGLSVGDATPRLAAGQLQVQAFGCHRCHGGGAPGRPAPNLKGLADKTSRRWAYDWLRNPTASHPTLAAGTADTERLDLEARVIVAYLWDRFRPADRPQPPSAEAAEGEHLFNSLGCRGCHGGGGEAATQAVQGPSLEDSGRKLRPSWLYAWLQNPRQVNPHTTMPDLRLSAEESAALAIFLANQGAHSSERGADAALPEVDEALRDRRLLDALSEQLTLRESQVHLDALGARQRNLLLGEYLLEARGCQGCHGALDQAVVPMAAGPLDAIAMDSLPRLASSHVPQLARALTEVTGRSWDPLVSHGTGNPRAAGPSYRIGAAQAMDLLVALLRPSAPATPSLRVASSPVMVRGEQLVARWGCRGCHSLDGWGGEVFSGGNAQQVPPPLDGIGQRLQADWLYDYLQDPSTVTVRPWLTARMPSYDLPPDDLLDLIEYFLQRDDVSALHHAAVPPSPQDLTVGSMVFEILQCERCHVGAEDPGGMEVHQLAPEYGLAKQRLRPQWGVDWLLDPRQFRASTTMPSYFGDEGQGDLAYLGRTFDSPMFIVHRQRLLRVFDDEEAMEEYLLDRRRVATALRDHVWSLGETSNVR